MKLDCAAALAMLVVASCGSFGEGVDKLAPPTPTAEAGTPEGSLDAGDIGPIPAEEPVIGNTDPGSTTTACASKMQAPGALFCSDFDDGDPWLGWDRGDPLSRYEVEKNEVHSAPNAAKLTIKDGINTSPDARLKHQLPANRRFTVNASALLVSPTKPPTDAIVLRLQFAKGSLFVRSTGRVVETIPQASGSAKFIEKLPSATVPLSQWLDFTFEVNLTTGEFALTVGGVKRSGTMDTKRPQAESVLLVAGPAEPNTETTAPDLTVWMDDVFVTAP